MSDETRDTVYIGKKPIMAYVTSTLIQLANLPSVNIKARGMTIGRAVDVAQIISRKTENAGYTIGEIRIGSESFLFIFHLAYLFSNFLYFDNSTMSLN